MLPLLPPRWPLPLLLLLPWLPLPRLLLARRVLSGLAWPLACKLPQPLFLLWRLRRLRSLPLLRLSLLLPLPPRP